MTDRPTEAAIDELKDALRRWHEGVLRVLEVIPSFGEDSAGAKALYLSLLLPAPVEGQDTWAVDDILSLHRAFADAVKKAQLDLPVYLTLRPDDDEEDHPDVAEPASATM